MKENINRFHTSNYKVGNMFNIPMTKSMLRKMKDEFPGDIIINFEGTGAKGYYILSLNGDMKEAKGVKKKVIGEELSGEDFKNLAENEGVVFRRMNTFKSSLYNI